MENIENNFLKFDEIGKEILLSIIPFKTYHDNKVQPFSWFDASGQTMYNGILLSLLCELKCNHSKQDNFDTTIITKHDFDNLINNTPSGVTPFYITFTNKRTYIFNLNKVFADPSVYEVKEVMNKKTEMGNQEMRKEEWVFINRHMAKKKGYMKRLFKGALQAGFDIDMELAKRYN